MLEHVCIRKVEIIKILEHIKVVTFVGPDRNHPRLLREARKVIVGDTTENFVYL